MPNTVIFELTVKVQYKLNGTPVNDLASKLTDIVDDAYMTGAFTGDSPAEVIAVHKEVKQC